MVGDYLGNEKGTHRQAAEIFHLSKSAVDKIWTRHKQVGGRGLKPKKGGVPLFL